MIEADNSIQKKIAAVVGQENVTTDREKLQLYSQDQSFTPRRSPHYIAYPGSTQEVQEIVKLAIEHKLPVVPRSSSVSLHGASIPTEGGILVDLKRMNRVIEIDERNWYAVIEPGVTFLELQEQLQSKGFRVAKPLLVPPSASVVSTYMERTPAVTAADFTYGAEHVGPYTVVSPTGETFTVGHPPLENAPAGAPDGPGLNFYRIFQGAQGTLGIVTWMIVRVLPIPKAQKVFFFPTSTIERSIEITRQIQKSELGLECFILNSFNMAALLSKESDDQTNPLKEGTCIGTRGAKPWNQTELEQFNSLKKSLPAWTVVVNLSAVGPIPDEKIAYQELDLKEATQMVGAEPKPTVGGIADLDKLVTDELMMSWRMQKRFSYRGSCHQIMFCSAPDRVEQFDGTVSRVTGQFSYKADSIGICLLPMERARSFYCTYDLHCNLADAEESAHVSNLFDKLSEELVEAGAFFDRPYGKWANLVYSRAGTYTEYLKKIKHELDPNNIMNPGKLCF